MMFHIVLILLIFCCPRALFSQERDGPEPYVIALHGELGHLHPSLNQRPEDRFVQGFVESHLVGVDHTGRFVPQLLEALPVEILPASGVQSDKLILRGKIRSGVKWGDGHPITADDVVFAWLINQRKRSLAGAIADATSLIQKIEIEKDQPDIFLMTMTHRGADYLASLAMLNLLPAHLERSLWLQAKGDFLRYMQLSLYTTSATNKGLYNGPYLPVELSSGRHILFEKNQIFYDRNVGPPKIKVMALPIIAELVGLLEADKVQMLAPLVPSMALMEALNPLIAAPASKLHIIRRPNNVLEHLVLNFNSSLLKNRRVRKALAYGLDRSSLVASIFGSDRARAVYPFPPDDPRVVSLPTDMPVYPYDSQLAKQLLLDSGWKMTKSGMRNASGRSTKISITINNNHPTRRKVAEAIKHNWNALGFDVRIKEEDARHFFAESIKKGAYDHSILYATKILPWASPREHFHSLARPKASNGFYGKNISGWRDSEVNHLIELIEGQSNNLTRGTLLSRIMRRSGEEVVSIPLFFQETIAVIGKDLRGFYLSSNSCFVSSEMAKKWAIATK